jgi:predicted RNA-binding Zn-ribbon protein involved in translation (DUF1610 family)
MANANATKVIPLNNSCAHSKKYAMNGHFCRICGQVINPTAEQKDPKNCLHKARIQKNLLVYNYCPTCGEEMATDMSLSEDDNGIVL